MQDIKPIVTIKVFRITSVEDDSRKVINRVRELNPTIVDLSRLNETDSQRTADLISGGVYALNGVIFNIADGLMYYGPRNVAIDEEESTASRRPDDTDNFSDADSYTDQFGM